MRLTRRKTHSRQVRFATHEAARAARRAAAELKSICDGIDTLYNERSYDGRMGEAGRDDDEGRTLRHAFTPRPSASIPV